MDKTDFLFVQLARVVPRGAVPTGIRCRQILLGVGEQRMVDMKQAIKLFIFISYRSVKFARVTFLHPIRILSPHYNSILPRILTNIFSRMLSAFDDPDLIRLHRLEGGHYPRQVYD